jgi:SAM-dependent methyltransferase
VSLLDRGRARARAARKRAVLRLEFLSQRFLREPRSAPPLNAYQQAFCTWNAQRLGITEEESRRRFDESAQTFRGGHGGTVFRTFNDISHSLYSVFASDRPTEVYAAYQLHAPAHFLRTLSHEPPRWSDDHVVVRTLRELDAPTIVDFGCGMAQTSFSLAAALQDRGCSPTLALADIPTLRLSFVRWLVQEWGFDGDVYECLPDAPVPALPACDAVIAREFFEHVHDPVFYMKAFDALLRPGGMLVTNVSDHHAEFMHVSPRLDALRSLLDDLGYEQVAKDRILRKPQTLASSTTDASALRPS